MLNKATIIGNLGSDPELRFTSGGQAVCRLAVATSRRYMNKTTNEMVEETEWHRVTVWGKQAEHCNTYLKKGRQVYVEGRLKTSSYEKDGQRHYTTEIVADDVKFLGGGERRDGAPRSDGGGARGAGGRRDSAASPSGGQGGLGGYGSGGYGSEPYEEPYAPSDPGADDIPF